MHGYNFTLRVRRVLERARIEAARMNHEFVGTEHIVLGLISENEGVSLAVLENLGIDLDAVRRMIEESVAHGGVRSAAPDLPYTTRAKKVLELSMVEADELNHSYIGTEHILLGVLREEQGIGARVLREAGLTVEKARAETVRLLGPAPELPAREELVAHNLYEGGPRSRVDHAHLVATLKLAPHPEGGHYREVFRSGLQVHVGDRERSAVTTIYYLLDKQEISRWHVVQSDEVWHFYAGAGLFLLDYDPSSDTLMQVMLGEQIGTPAFVHVIGAGHWQAAVPAAGASLAGCTVAPGFEFVDFKMVRDIPGHEAAFEGRLRNFVSLL